MPVEYDLLSLRKGTITAPAGCGKTQLIVNNMMQHSGPKPVLILTHTNAGLTSLRLRLKRANVPSHAFRISTIDGFAMRLVSTFPVRSGIDAAILELRNRDTDYPSIREGACALLQAGHLNEILSATYANLIVDEYQDCNLAQHTLITTISEVLPTCVLGDPMQAIFGIGGNHLVDWNNNVLQQFPPVGELTKPWRWINARTPMFGQWLLECRQVLHAGGRIDLRNAPNEVTWVELSLAAAEKQRRDAVMSRSVTANGQVLIIGDSKNPKGRQLMASRAPGSATIEPVELSDLTNFGQAFDLKAGDALTVLVHFTATLMTRVGVSTLLPRLESLRKGKAHKPPTPAENALLAFSSAPSYPLAIEALTALKQQENTQIYRPEIFYGCLHAMQRAASGSCTFVEATIRERERNRYESRPLARRAIGSTLLLKGLEAEVAVIPSIKDMDSCHLYVAMTRGSSRLVICSESPELNSQ